MHFFLSAEDFLIEKWTLEVWAKVLSSYLLLNASFGFEERLIGIKQMSIILIIEGIHLALRCESTFPIILMIFPQNWLRRRNKLHIIYS